MNGALSAASIAACSALRLRLFAVRTWRGGRGPRVRRRGSAGVSVSVDDVGVAGSRPSLDTKGYLAACQH